MRRPLTQWLVGRLFSCQKQLKIKILLTTDENEFKLRHSTATDKKKEKLRIITKTEAKVQWEDAILKKKKQQKPAWNLAEYKNLPIKNGSLSWSFVWNDLSSDQLLYVNDSCCLPIV